MGILKTRAAESRHTREGDITEDTPCDRAGLTLRPGGGCEGARKWVDLSTCLCELYPWCMYGCLCVSLCLFMCACVCLCCVRFFKGAGIVEATVAQRQLVWPPCWMRISGWVTPAVIPVASSSVLVVNNSVPVPYYCIDLCKYP